MHLERLEIAGCRNLTSVALDLSAGLNLFVGLNGAGKTSLLEAAHLLARGRSFRTARIGAVIQRGQESLIVHGRIQDEIRGTQTLGLARHRHRSAERRINGRPGHRSSDAAAIMPVQLMLPDAAALVFGEPGLRRRFMDWGAFHVKRAYIDALRGYQRALRHRNALLRSAQGQTARLTAEIDAWSGQVVEQGTAVTAIREDYVSRLREMLPRVIDALAPGLALDCALQRGWPQDVGFADSMSESLPRDVKLGSTQQGPHRADLRLETGDELASAVLSRGQAKLAASALHLAQAALTADGSGRASIFLIDDLGAELDREHNRRFFHLLAETGCQVLATATAPPPLHEAFPSGQRRLFHVEQGTCRLIDTDASAG